MDLITCDAETYYTNDGLGFKTQTTEEYVNDPRFHVIGVSVKVNDDPTVWYTGEPEYVFAKLHQYDWANSAMLCHNTLFDGFIFATHFGIIPKMYLDTLSMARAVHGVDVGGSLKFLAEKYKIGVKGTEVDGAMNLKRTDFTPKQLAQYGAYCCNDTEITFALFQKLVSQFPEDELRLIDMTIRMFTQPVLEVNDAILSERLAEIHKDKNDLLNGLMARLDCANEEAVRKILASNKQFAELLTELGIDPPMKESPTTGKQTFALAKNDEGFLALCEHEDEFIQRLCAVRLGTKSTLEESRIARFIDIAARNRGRLPIPLKYYGAHTGRWSGMDSVNFQNLPSRDKKKKTLKNAIIVPEGHTLINCDSSQIEARVLAWLAGQDELTAAFARGEDVYSVFASKIYNRLISKADPVERFVGKTCILGLGFGTGALKLQHTLKTSPPGAILSEQECKDIVSLYRETNDKVPALWKDGDRLLEDLVNWNPNSYKPFWFGEHECVKVDQQGILLPNGLYIRYPGLYLNTEESKSQYMYKSRKGPVYLWGGTVVENVVQALARIIVGQQMLRIHERYPVKLTVHDAALVVVKNEEFDEAMKFIVDIMSIPPAWAKGLPVACEAKFGESYGQT